MFLSCPLCMAHAGIVYAIDVSRMVQRNPFTHKEREIILQFPSNPADLLKLASVPQVTHEEKKLVGIYSQTILEMTTAPHIAVLVPCIISRIVA